MNKTMHMHTFKRIAINTSGGDTSGLNAVIHAAMRPSMPREATFRLGIDED
jgi:6-phosphofructokinase